MSKITDEIREKIIAANDIKSEIVTVDGWGVDVEVRTITGLEMENIDNKSDNFRSELIAASCFAPGTDEKLFSLTDVEMLNSKSAASTGKILRVALKLNGWSDEGRDALKKD